MIKQLMVSMVLVSTAIAAQAQQAQTAGGYIGASVGRSSVKFKDSNSTTCGTGLTCTYTKDENDTGWRGYGGYQFNQYGAVEVGYMNFGEVSQNLAYSAPAAIAGTTLGARYKADGIYGDIVGTAPLSDQFAVLGRLGVMYSTMKTTATTNNAALTAALVARGFDFTPEHSEWNARAGVGAQFNFSKSIGVRIEWEKTLAVGDKNKTGEGDIGFLSLGLQVKF